MPNLRFALRRLDIATRLACAVALMLVALAHRPMVAQAAELSAYALPDGSLPTLCLPGERSDHGIAKDAGCAYCRIATAVLLPVPPAITWPAPVAGARIAALHAVEPPGPAGFGSRSPRGPPAVS